MDHEIQQLIENARTMEDLRRVIYLLYVQIIRLKALLKQPPTSVYFGGAMRAKDGSGEAT